MAKSTVFKTNRTQAVRIPKELAFPDSVKEVEIIRDGDDLRIMPKDMTWKGYFARPSTLPDDFPDDIDELPFEKREPL